jgi:hypothetical protein
MKIPTKQGYLEIDQTLEKALAQKYPHTDVSAELHKMYLWAMTKPSARWTQSRGLVGVQKWLKKCEAINAARGGSRKVSKVVDAWWTDNHATMDKAAQVGITPRPGEDYPALRRRIKAKLDEQVAA